jgi:hypothetical protein
MRFLSKSRPSRRRLVQRISTFHEFLPAGALSICARGLNRPPAVLCGHPGQTDQSTRVSGCCRSPFLASRQSASAICMREGHNVCSRLTSSKDHPHQLSETEKIVYGLCLHLLLKSITTTVNNNNNIALKFYCLFRVPFPRTQRCRPKIRMPGIYSKIGAHQGIIPTLVQYLWDLDKGVNRDLLHDFISLRRACNFENNSFSRDSPNHPSHRIFNNPASYTETNHHLSSSLSAIIDIDIDAGRGQLSDTELSCISEGRS